MVAYIICIGKVVHVAAGVIIGNHWKPNLTGKKEAMNKVQELGSIGGSAMDGFFCMHKQGLDTETANERIRARARANRLDKWIYRCNLPRRVVNSEINTPLRKFGRSALGSWRL